METDQMSDNLEALKKTAIKAEDNVEKLESELADLENADEVDKSAVKSKKVELRKAESEVKKAKKAVAKEKASIAKEEERASKLALKEEEKAKKEAERAEKAAIKEEEKARKVAEREANRMPEQNGIRRPKPNTKCGLTWQIADDLSNTFGQPTPIKDLLEATRKEGLNEGNVKAEYARWRKFHGVSGRITLPKEEEISK